MFNRGIGSTGRFRYNFEMNTKSINECVNKILSAIPEELRNATFDVEKNVRAALEGVLNRCNLVTREEFDAQIKVLQRTREKLNALEKIVNELEK